MFNYFIGVFFFLGIWSILFALVPKSRKPILWTSFAWGHIGPISNYWFFKDYWKPTYILKFEIGNWVFGIEDYLFAFAFSGLCAGIFDLFIRKSGQKEVAKWHTLGYIKFLLLGFSCVLIMGILRVTFKINSLYAIVVIFLAGALFILIQQPGWIIAGIKTAIIVVAIMWIFYWGFYLRLFPNIIEQWWINDALSKMSFDGVPIEEIMYAGAAGLFIGPSLRYCMEKTGEKMP